ncbi:hypothetical protein D3248_02105 [Leucobacter zeae]|nr:hypothetical protein [Leucobacter zeae]
MWGSISGASLTFLELHVQLADELTHLAWARTQVWDNSVSVHAWSPAPGTTVKVDVVPRKDVTSISVIVTPQELLPELRAVLLNAGMRAESVEGYPRVTRIADVPREGTGIPSGHAKTVAGLILQAREAIDQGWAGRGSE